MIDNSRGRTSGGTGEMVEKGAADDQDGLRESDADRKGDALAGGDLPSDVQRPPGPGPTATRAMPIGGDLRRSTRLPDLRRLILLSVISVLASLAVTASASAATFFSNPTPTKIPGSGSAGRAAPSFPSEITVSGLVGPITDVNVTLFKVRPYLARRHGHPARLAKRRQGDADVRRLRRGRH